MQALEAMSAFEKVSVADIPARSARRSKTTPLREAITALQPEEAFYVPYFDKETGEDGESSRHLLQSKFWFDGLHRIFS